MALSRTAKLIKGTLYVHLTGEHRIQIRVPAQGDSTVCRRHPAVWRPLWRAATRVLRLRRHRRVRSRLVPARAGRRHSTSCSCLLNTQRHLANVLELTYCEHCGGTLKNTALFCLLQVANLPVYIWTASVLLYRLDYGDDSLHNYCDQSVLAENEPSRSLIIIVSFYACVMDIACDLVHRAERPVVRFSVRSLVSTHSLCAIYVIYLM